MREIYVSLDRAANVVEAYRDSPRGGELRLVAGDVGASGGSLTVPTTVSSEVYAYMTAAVAMRRMRTTIVTTDGGEPKLFPKVATHGLATQVANQNTTFAGTDPVLATMTLNAFDAGQLISVSNDLLEDTAANITQFIAEQLGRGIGELTSSWYITGSGSGQPQGMEGAVIGAGTISTGGSLIDPTVEKYIDLVYSVNGNYTARGSEWLFRDLTAATVRKLRDGAVGTVGAFLWQPSPTVGIAGGEPDDFLGYPVFTDPNVASLASNTKNHVSLATSLRTTSGTCAASGWNVRTTSTSIRTRWRSEGCSAPTAISSTPRRSTRSSGPSNHVLGRSRERSVPFGIASRVEVLPKVGEGDPSPGDPTCRPDLVVPSWKLGRGSRQPKAASEFSVRARTLLCFVALVPAGRNVHGFSAALSLHRKARCSRSYVGSGRAARRRLQTRRPAAPGDADAHDRRSSAGRR